MSCASLNHAIGTAASRESRHGGSNTRGRLLRTACITLAAAWLSVLPNPTGSAATPQSATANSASSDRTPHFAIPLCLLDEHAELYSGLNTAANLPGETGTAARRVMTLLKPHMDQEQRIAYPLLRLLPMLEAGPVEPWMNELLPLADQLRAALPNLKREHVQILSALDGLRTAAWAEQHPEHAFLAERVKHHIQVEEHILYPAALITAEYVHLRQES